MRVETKEMGVETEAEVRERLGLGHWYILGCSYKRGSKWISLQYFEQIIYPFGLLISFSVKEAKSNCPM